MSEPLGQPFVMIFFVNSDHAGESVTRRSRTGCIIFLKNESIYWISKKQSSCKTSTFGSNFVAMKQATEYVRGVWYKLRIIGIAVTESLFVYGYNQTVLCNTTMPGSSLKNKYNAIAFHFVREGCVHNECRITYINMHFNVADLTTKPLLGEKQWFFVRMLQNYIIPSTGYVVGDLGKKAAGKPGRRLLLEWPIPLKIYGVCISRRLMYLKVDTRCGCQWVY